MIFLISNIYDLMLEYFTIKFRSQQYMGVKSSEIITECILQLLDLPGIIEGAKDGKGRGRQVIAVARTCSLIFIVLDVLKPLGHKRLIEHELEGFGLRLNKQPPNITFKKKDKGGINLQTMVRKQFIRSVEIINNFYSTKY